MSDEQQEDDKRAIPPWVMTFADLMSLLMCFFVLLLSFSEMDAIRFQTIAHEMAQAFGVQRDVAATEPPMGTSPIFDQFSPGIPRPTPIDSVRQETSDERPQLRTFTSDDVAVEMRVEDLVQEQMEKSVEQLAEVLQEEIEQGVLQLEQEEKRIVIRIEERGSFPSGSADMTPAFGAMLDRIGRELVDTPGIITVEGHTDDVPIRTARFQSNWDLSAARASSVANAFLRNPAIEPVRLKVQGFAETRPRADNASAEGRALNRRVEIILDMSEPLAGFEARARQLIAEGREELIVDLEW